MSSNKQQRGMLSQRIIDKSKELLGYSITQKELRLLVYVLYEAVNNKKIDNVNDEEKEILSTWIDKQFLAVTGLGNLLWISEDFFNKGNQLVYLGYVDLGSE
jgi:hypothetical protein